MPQENHPAKDTIHIAIACDNWKLPMFEGALNLGGFKWTKHRFTKGTTTLKIECVIGDTGRVHALCAKVQSQAFHQKSKTN